MAVDPASQKLMDELSHNEEIDKRTEEQSEPMTQSTEPTPSVATSNDVKEVDGPNLGSKRSLTSFVWDHFQRKTINGNVKAICNYYNKHLRGDGKAGTSHLSSHLRICGKKKCSDIKQAVFKTEHGSHGKTLIGSALNFDQDNSRLKLSLMIVLHELPFRLTELVGFREYSSSLQPIFKMPSRNTVRSDIMKLYEYEKSRMMNMFQKNCSRVAITTDMWTSNQKKGFMSITAHYIDDSWSLQSRIIRFAYVMSPHTADVLCGVLIESLMDWNIDTKLSTLTLDNCSTNDALINLVLERFSSKKSV